MIAKRSGLVAAVALLAACGGNKDNLYLRSDTAPPLEVPPDLTKPVEEQRYQIPQIGALLTDKVALADGDIRLEREGRMRWLVARLEPAALWRRVNDFWVDAGVNLAWQAPDLGIMETEWLDNRDSSFAKDRYRVRIEPGREPGTSELYLTHRGMREEYTGGEWVSVWGDPYSDPELEVEVMGRMLRFLGVSTSKARQLEKDAGQGAEAATLQTAGEGTYMLLDAPLYRAWQRIGVALDREGYELLARDRAKGQFTVRPSQGQGVARKVVFGGGAGDEFLVRLRQEAQNTRVEVGAPDGDADPQMAKEILSRLHAQLR